MKKTLVYLFLGLSAFVLVACSTKNNDPYHLRIAYSPSLCQAPLHIAVEKGFFEAEGIKPENIQLDASHAQEAVGTNQVDLGFGLVSKFLQPVENGLPVKFIAGIHNGCIKILSLKKSGIHLKEKEIKKIAEEYEFLPGPNPAILALATGLGEQLFGNQMIDGATYCYNIVYGLTGDDKVKELMEGLAKINM